MADKPYTERTGGRYVRDKQTGRVTPAAKAKPEKPTPTAQTPGTIAEDQKGKSK